ncbi:MAG: diacylglycerol kinase family protein [Chloroflexia bacterium]
MNTEQKQTQAPDSAFRVPHSAFIQGFVYAWAGVRYCFRTQRNFRVHIGIGIVAVVLGLLLGLGWVEWALVATVIALVLAAEMVNTMVESLVDLVTQQYHPLAKVAKDVSAGVVLLTAIGAAVVGILIFLPKLLAGIRF